MTPDELAERADKELERQQGYRERLHCCTAAGCQSCGGDQVKAALAKRIKEGGLDKQIEVIGTGCMGLCSKGPLIKRQSDEALFVEVSSEDVAPLIDAKLTPALEQRKLDLQKHPFFAGQLKIVLANAGKVDPERIDSSIAAGGYSALAKVLTTMKPADVIDEVTKSGLRGRGGAGYPTGVKWQLVGKQDNDTKYVVCNADEGDPGAFMDRSVLEGDPHRVLEGMAIAGYAVGANQGYLYVRGEYALAISRLQAAIKQAEREGCLGARILDSNFRFQVEIRIGAGAFVCGEETALINSHRGWSCVSRGPRPPYPPRRGSVAEADADQQRRDLREHRADHHQRRRVVRVYRDRQEQRYQGVRGGRQDSRTGLVEVPMGTPVRQIV
jgi:bidirectional [NiFe] hydrogenase diaphorase subunit